METLSRLGRMLRQAHDEYEQASSECIRLATSADSTKEQIEAADLKRREIYKRYVALLSEHTGALVSWEAKHHRA